MNQVWKFTLSPECELEMPEGAQILSVQSQGHEICMWAHVNPENPKVKRKFITVGTGHNIDSDLSLSYYGTSLLHEGRLVFHTFEIVEP